MTATHLEPVVIEGIDLDGTPACQNDGCSSPAAVRIRFWCGCPWLCCTGHYAGLQQLVVSMLLEAEAIECTMCGGTVTPTKVSDVIKAVIPL